MIAPPNIVSDKQARMLDKARVSRGLLPFTQYFFVEMYKRKYVTSIHHRMICDALDKVFRGEITKLIINLPPRYGKTELAVKNFIAYCLAMQPSAKFIHLSYSDELALDNSEGIKSIVQHESYKALFPQTRISKNSTAKKKWYTTAGGGVYATSTAGQVTGFGAGRVDEEPTKEAIEAYNKELDDELNAIPTQTLGSEYVFGGAMVIDDSIKPEDADSAIKRDKINGRWDSTLKNRLNSRRTPIFMIGHRTHEYDLFNHVLTTEPGEWYVLKLPAIMTDEEGNESALWPFKQTLDELYDLRSQIPLVFGRQYMQNPTPKEGLMYGTEDWKTYQYGFIPPSQRTRIKAYVDTADTGKDYLCSIIYAETEAYCYLLDVYYTQKAMEITEPETAQRLTNHKVSYALIESNNGGRGFARNVDRLLKILRNLATTTRWFHQSGNKEARIFTRSAEVKNVLVMPDDWAKRWPDFYRHVTTYMRVGKNAYDDAPDCMTGIVENFGGNTIEFEGGDNS